MKTTAILLILGIVLCGCKPADEANNAPTVGATTSTNSPATTPTGSGVAPMAAGAGGITPMSGTESVQGAGGGGVGQAAKQMAKDKAANMGGSSLDQGAKDDTGE